MSVHIELAESGDHVHVTMTRGDRLAIAVRVDARRSATAAARLEAWRGADWLAQVRTTPGAASPSASFEVTEAIDDSDETGDVGIWAFVIDDTDALEADESYVFDFQLDSGPLAPYTYLAGSSISVEGDVSREVAP